MSNETYQIPVKNRDIMNIFKALNALDGQPEAVKVRAPDGAEVTQLIVKPYAFGGKTRLALAKWLTRVKESNDQLSKVHDALVKQFADPATPERVGPDKLQEFQAEWDKVLDEPALFALSKIAVDDLKTEENKIPVSVLAVLDPILA